MPTVKETKAPREAFANKYDVVWQKKLIGVLFRDPLFAEQFSEVVNLESFSDKNLKTIAKYFFEFRRRYGEYPELDNILSSILFFAEEESNNVVLRNIIQEITNYKEIKNEGFIKESALSFSKNSKLVKAIQEIAEMSKFELGDYEFGVILKKMESVVYSGINYERGHIYKDSLLKRYSTTARIPITTGITKLDEIMSGGLGKGELGLVVGGTGSGKSMFLTWLATQAAKKGYTVFYYTMELSEVEIGKRVDACLTGIPLNILVHNLDKIEEKAKEMEGTLIIKEYPMKQCSIQTLRSHISKEIAISNKPDIIFIDYVDTMQFSSKYTELRHNLQTVMEELRGLAKELNIAVWTASQTNRDGYSNSNPGLEHISESFGKTFSTDFTLTIGRTDKEKRSGEAVYKVAKNRNGIDGISFFGKMDTLRVQIDFYDEFSSEERKLKEKKDTDEFYKETIEKFLEEQGAQI
ncbi:MAG: AAA family ATPase [Patescibacteria group bacterium]|nr:AAA family ATPase [Patescibacteria group bacterium]